MTRCRPRGSGQALVEFALVAPILLVFIFGVLDLGRGIYTYSVVSDVAREGARYAIVHGNLAPGDGMAASGPSTTDPSGGTTVIPASKAVAFGIDPSQLIVGVCWGSGCTVSNDCTTATSTALSPGTNVPVVVRACYRFQPFTGALLHINSISLAAQASLAVTH